MKKRDIICMVCMSMGKQDSLDIWFFWFFSKMSEQIISIDALDIRDQSHLKKITDTICSTRCEEFFEELTSFSKTHSEIQKYLGI